MALLRRYAPSSMDLPLRICSRPAPQQRPLWMRQSGRGGLLVSHGGCLRQDNWAVPSWFRFVASAANLVNSVSAQPQYMPILFHRQQHLSSSAKMNLLQNSGRAQGRRLFCIYSQFIPRQGNCRPELGKPSIATAKSKLDYAVEKNNRTEMLECLGFLKELLPGNHDYCNESFTAADLLWTVVSPLRKHGGLDDDVVKESLEVALLLLDKASEKEICIDELFEDVGLTPILKRIIGDYGESADHPVIKLANQILAKLP